MEPRHWQHSKFKYPDRVPTMISLEERRYLHWLGASAWTGEGSIVEIGPWLGGSTVCLAAGMRDSGHQTGKRLHVIDNFIWREFMGERAPLPIKPGKTFEPYFLKNVAPYADIVDSHRRALPDEEITEDEAAAETRFNDGEQIPVLEKFAQGPVEVLFIDGAKSWRGMQHLLNVMNSSLIPDKSLLVCQDYKYWGCYWVQVMMARLRDHIEPVHNVLDGCTITFRLRSAIPGDLLAGFEDHMKDLPVDQTLAEIAWAAKIATADDDRLGTATVSLAKVSYLAHKGRMKEAVSQFIESEKSWPSFSNTGQLDRARGYLETRVNRRFPAPRRLLFEHMARRLLCKGRRVLGIQ